MTSSPGEAQFMAGYNAARALCLTNGTSEPGRTSLGDNPRTDDAFVAGYEWALYDYDYDDANGLPRAKAAG